MRRATKRVLLVLSALVAATAGAVAFSSELRSALLFEVVPGFASRQHLRRFENAEGQVVHLLGTIHGGHLDEEAFGLEHLAAAIERIRPDLLLVESRPEEIERGNVCDGPVEMGFASLVARSRGIESRGMDYWEKRAGGTVLRNTDEREAEMIRRASEQLTGRRSVLVLTGFSHVAGFAAKLLERGFREVELPSTEKERLLSIEDRKAAYPEGLAACLERRIEEDTRELKGETDAAWRSNIEQNIALRRRFLALVEGAAPR